MALSVIFYSPFVWIPYGSAYLKSGGQLPYAGATSGHSWLAGWAQPLSIGDPVESRSQAEQVEGLVALITEYKFLIITWKRSASTIRPFLFNFKALSFILGLFSSPTYFYLDSFAFPDFQFKQLSKSLTCSLLSSYHYRFTCRPAEWLAPYVDLPDTTTLMCFDPAVAALPGSTFLQPQHRWVLPEH